jgi:hypothetical protein
MAVQDLEGFTSHQEAADARLLLYATGFILDTISEKYGDTIQPKEIAQRTRSAASIIITQVGHDGCMAMEGYEVQDLLCRLSGLFTELNNSMKRNNLRNASTLCAMLAGRLGVFCGRTGGGDKRAYKQQVKYSNTMKPPMPGR